MKEGRSGFLESQFVEARLSSPPLGSTLKTRVRVIQPATSPAEVGGEYLGTLGEGKAMPDTTFQSFVELLIGDWVGHRRGTTLDQELVRSQWRAVLDGGFLHERWHTAGGGALPELTAEAFFRVSDSGPSDFVAVYKHGKIAFGESTFEGSEWILTHRWLREPGIARVRLRFRDDDTYEQEVAEITPDGVLKHESSAVLTRKHTRG